MCKWFVNNLYDWKRIRRLSVDSAFSSEMLTVIRRRSFFPVCFCQVWWSRKSPDRPNLSVDDGNLFLDLSIPYPSSEAKSIAQSHRNVNNEIANLGRGQHIVLAKDARRFQMFQGLTPLVTSQYFDLMAGHRILRLAQQAWIRISWVPWSIPLAEPGNGDLLGNLWNRSGRWVFPWGWDGARRSWKLKAEFQIRLLDVSDEHPRTDFWRCTRTCARLQWLWIGDPPKEVKICRQKNATVPWQVQNTYCK